jgi:kynurenine formamidase
MTKDRFVDLSWPITAGTSIFPDDPVPHIEVFSTIESIGYNLFNVSVGTQTGTHVDAPYHFLYSGDTIDKMELDYFFGESIVIDVSGKDCFYEIGVDDIKNSENAIKRTGIVLLRTNWYLKFGTREFLNHPYLSLDAAKELITWGVKTVCIDTLNLDRTGRTVYPIHSLFAEKRIMIAENMINFDKIKVKNPLICCFPLNLKGCDGSPVRAVAIESSAAKFQA